MNLMHGLLFGGFFLLCVFGALATLLRRSAELQPSVLSARGARLEQFIWAFTALLGWAAVFSGTYLIYPWYRAPAPAGVPVDLAAHPKFKLLANPNTVYWHTIGMEWKEHIAFFAPIAITLVAYLLWRYRDQMPLFPAVRRAAFAFAATALIATSIAGLFGVMLDKLAPVEGGRTYTLLQPPATR